MRGLSQSPGRDIGRAFGVSLTGTLGPGAVMNRAAAGYGPAMEWLRVYDAHTVGEGRLDPSSPEAAHRRLARIAATLPVSVESARWVESAVNNVWQIENLFLRISFRGDRGRLHREAALLGALPSQIPHVEVVDVGDSDGL
jgi:hypothetical protein